jgi:hypothetical protein
MTVNSSQRSFGQSIGDRLGRIDIRTGRHQRIRREFLYLIGRCPGWLLVINFFRVKAFPELL